MLNATERNDNKDQVNVKLGFDSKNRQRIADTLRFWNIRHDNPPIKEGCEYGVAEAVISIISAPGDSGKPFSNSQLKTLAFEKLREAEKAMHAYASSLDVGTERVLAFEVFENIRNAGRVG